MQSFELYIFDRHNRLVGAQNVSRWSLGDIEETIATLKLIDRTGIVSDKGRSICATCFKDLGECEVPPGQLSHGNCPQCFVENMR